jgi:hypothetical protein
LQPPRSKVEGAGGSSSTIAASPPASYLYEVRSTLILASAALALAACRGGKATPAEATGDAFVDHYLAADQDGALPFTALTAKTQLQKELADVKDARLLGAPDVHASWRRVGEETREKRTVLHYDITIDKNAPKRDLRVEVTDLGEGPKVVLYELK